MAEVSLDFDVFARHIVEKSEELERSRSLEEAVTHAAGIAEDLGLFFRVVEKLKSGPTPLEA